MRAAYLLGFQSGPSFLKSLGFTWLAVTQVLLMSKADWLHPGNGTGEE